MPIKIDLKPPKWLRRLATPPKAVRELEVKFTPKDLLLGARVATGTATPADITAKALEIAHVPGFAGQKEKIMIEKPSWKKLTITGLTIFATLLQLWLQPNVTTPEQAAVVIAGLLVTLVLGAIYLLTQGKVDMQKLRSTPTGAAIEEFVEAKLAALLKPALDKVTNDATNEKGISAK